MLFRHHQLVVILSVVLSFIGSNCYSLPFSIGAIEGQFDTDLSIKNSWSIAKPNHHFVGYANGGRGFTNTVDNGLLNYKRGDSFSRLFKGKHNLHLKYNDVGLFISGQYWYDFVTKDQTQSFSNVSDKTRYVSNRSSGAEWRQFFTYYHYQLAGKQGTFKLGQQLLNWGEERYIVGGINVINPMDKREGWRSDMDTRTERIPVSLLYVSQQMTDNLSGEFFYQLDWRPEVNSNCGTFWALNDYTTHGCNNYLRVLQGNNQLSKGELASIEGVNINREGVLVAREKDHRASSAGQFGLAIHYYFIPIQTDVGFYFINYHSRSGFTNGRTANKEAVYKANDLGYLASEWLAGNSRYYIDYPENIHLYGVSFSKDITADLIWQGEFSYRPNMPIQVNKIQLFDTLINKPITTQQKVKGYDRKRVSEFQTSLTKNANEVMAAEQFTLTSSLGMIYVAGINSNTLYGRDEVFGYSSICPRASRYCEKDGFTTSFSWGYRIRGEWQYRNMWTPRLTLKPSISWLHDMQGYSPSNEAALIKDRKALSFGITAEYLRTYYMGLNYTSFWGGRYDRWSDRDFMSLELGLKF